MGSKAFLILGLFLAIFLLISSEVVARELVETSNSVKPNNENVEGYGVVGDGHYGGGYHKGGGYGKGGGYKRCRYRCKKYCCSYEEYAAMGKATEAQPQN